MGTPEFAVETLKKLVSDGYKIVGVITAPDKPAGRGRKIAESAVKQFAKSHEIPVLQPFKLKDKTFLNELKTLQADLQIVVAFRMLPEVVWAMPPLGTFNLHASLLPQYRGAAPINWAVINGETKTGVTTFFIEQKIDTGNILFQEEVPINQDDTAGNLHDKLMYVGAKLVSKTVGAILSNQHSAQAQKELISDTEQLRPAPKIYKDDCRINWNMSAKNVYNFIRGLSPYPAAWSELVGDNECRKIKIFRATIGKPSSGVGVGTLNIEGKNIIRIACADNYLEIKELQLAGKKRMPVDEFLRGFSLTNYKKCQ